MWLKLYKPPFDPTVEILEIDGDRALILKADELEGLKQSELYGVAGLMVRRMNSIAAAIVGRSDVSFGGMCEIESGVLRRHPYAKAESASISWGMGVAEFEMRDADGNLVKMPPAPTEAQKYFSAGQSNSYIGDALSYCGPQADWFDLYKAYECLKAGRFLIGVSTDRFSRTANSYRHRTGGPKPPPTNPISLEVARKLVRSWIGAAVRASEARGNDS